MLHFDDEFAHAIVEARFVEEYFHPRRPPLQMDIEAPQPLNFAALYPSAYIGGPPRPSYYYSWSLTPYVPGTIRGRREDPPPVRPPTPVEDRQERALLKARKAEQRQKQRQNKHQMKRR